MSSLPVDSKPKPVLQGLGWLSHCLLALRQRQASPHHSQHAWREAWAVGSRDDRESQARRSCFQQFWAVDVRQVNGFSAIFYHEIGAYLRLALLAHPVHGLVMLPEVVTYYWVVSVTNPKFCSSEPRPGPRGAKDQYHPCVTQHGRKPAHDSSLA